MGNMDWGVGSWGATGLSPVAGLMVVLILWTIFWKGLALWKAARKDSKVWFVILLLVNTAGILEILYLFVFSSRGFNMRIDDTLVHGRRASDKLKAQENKEDSDSDTSL